MQLIADNLHVINPVIRKALDTYDPKPIREIVLKMPDGRGGRP